MRNVHEDASVAPTPTGPSGSPAGVGVVGCGVDSVGGRVVAATADPDPGDATPGDALDDFDEIAGGWVSGRASCAVGRAW